MLNQTESLYIQFNVNIFSIDRTIEQLSEFY